MFYGRYERPTLVIGGWQSNCSVCGANTLMADTCTPCGYGTPPPSCGAVFVQWDFTYSNVPCSGYKNLPAAPEGWYVQQNLELGQENPSLEGESCDC